MDIQKTQEPLSAREVRDALMPLIKITKQTSYVDGYEATDEEAMGLLVSKFFKWDGLAIGETAEHAFEDSNFRELNEQFGKLLDKEFRNEEL